MRGLPDLIKLGTEVAIIGEVDDAGNTQKKTAQMSRHLRRV